MGSPGKSSIGLSCVFLVFSTYARNWRSSTQDAHQFVTAPHTPFNIFTLSMALEGCSGVKPALDLLHRRPNVTTTLLRILQKCAKNVGQIGDVTLNGPQFTHSFPGTIHKPRLKDALRVRTIRVVLHAE